MSNSFNLSISVETARKDQKMFCTRSGNAKWSTDGCFVMNAYCSCIVVIHWWFCSVLQCSRHTWSCLAMRLRRASREKPQAAWKRFSWLWVSLPAALTFVLLSPLLIFPLCLLFFLSVCLSLPIWVSFFSFLFFLLYFVSCIATHKSVKAYFHMTPTWLLFVLVYTPG